MSRSQTREDDCEQPNLTSVLGVPSLSVPVFVSVYILIPVAFELLSLKNSFNVEIGSVDEACKKKEQVLYRMLD